MDDEEHSGSEAFLRRLLEYEPALSQTANE